MDEGQYQETVKRLEAVNAVIKGLDPAVRDRALQILTPYVTGQPGGRGGGNSGGEGGDEEGGLVTDAAVDALLDAHKSDNASDNGLLIAAIFYSRYGKGPYEVKEFKRFGDQQDLLFPDQFHKTVGKRKTDEGNAIFRKVSNGWQITVNGEKWLRDTYKVGRGNQTKAGELSP